MPEFRFTGRSPQGKKVKSEFEADNKRKAKKKVEQVAKSKNLTIESIDKKQTFQYKVKKNGQKKITGEQEAYSKEELERALNNLGYEVIRVNKKWFDFTGGVPNKEVVNFIRLSANLLKQKLSFDEILNLLQADTTNKKMKQTIKEIQKDLKDGKEGKEVYGKHDDVFGEFAAYMLSVASTSGNMAQVFESTAKFLERDQQFKKNLRKALLMPAITLVAAIGVALFYVGYIFPQTAGMFAEMGINLEKQAPMTAATLDMSRWLQANWLSVVMAFVAPIAGFAYFISTSYGRLWFDKNIIKLPVIGDITHKTSIEIFSRVFYTLYSGAGQNIEVIRTAAEACRNKYMEKQIKQVAIKGMIEDGAGLVESLENTGVFTRTAISRFRLGAQSGALKENAKQLADYYEVLTSSKMETVSDMTSLFVNIVIMIVLVAITLVSSETARINPGSQMGGM